MRRRQPCVGTGQSVVLHDWGVGLMGMSLCVSGQSGAVTSSRIEQRACIYCSPTSGQENGSGQHRSCIAPYEQVYLSVKLDGPTSDPLVRALPFRCGKCVNSPHDAALRNGD